MDNQEVTRGPDPLDRADEASQNLNLATVFAGGSFGIDFPSPVDGYGTSFVGRIDQISYDQRNRLCITLSWMAQKFTFSEWKQIPAAKYRFNMADCIVVYDGENTAFLNWRNNTAMNATLFSSTNTARLDNAQRIASMST